MNRLSNSWYKWLGFIFVCLITLSISYLSTPLTFKVGMLDALALDGPENRAALSIGKNFQNKMVIFIGASNRDDAQLTVNNLKQILDQTEGVQSAENTPFNPDQLSQLINYYQQQPFAYLSQKQKLLLQNKNTEELEKHYFTLLNQWLDPIVSQSIEVDTSLTIAAFLKERFNRSNTWTFDGQNLFIKTPSTYYYPLFIDLKSDALGINRTISIYQDLTAFETELNADVDMLMSGVLVHTAVAAIQGKNDITILGSISLVGVFLLILLSFRGLKPLVAILTVLSASVLCGFTALQLLFSSVHLLSFMFAISIVGIAVDYGFHVLVMRQYQSNVQQVRKEITRPLAIALLSTLLGYSLFISSPIEFLHQVVAFVGFGLIGAFVTAIWLLPEFKASKQGFSLAIKIPRKKRYLFIALASFVLCIPTITFNDNIANLNNKNKRVIDDELLISELSKTSLYPNVVMVSADNEQSLLRRTQQLSKELKNILESEQQVSAITDWYLDHNTQQQNVDIFQLFWQTNEYKNVRQYLDSQQINRQLSQPYISNPPPAFVLEKQGLNIIVQDGKFWTAIILSKPLSEQQKALVEATDGAKRLNLPATISQRLAEFRAFILWLSVLALLLIGISLSIYLGLYQALTIVSVTLASAGVALVLSHLLIGSLNIFNILACLLIFTLTLDYMVFFQAHGEHPKVSHTIGLSSASSALTFGVMAFSSTPAVSSFGITLLIGIIAGWALCHLTPIHNYNYKERT